MSLKKSFLVRSEILGLLVNTLTADCEYAPHNRENLALPTQMQLSKKVKTCWGFVIAFLESTFNFKNFEKKIESHRLSISEIIDSERRG